MGAKNGSLPPKPGDLTGLGVTRACLLYVYITCNVCILVIGISTSFVGKSLDEIRW